jgi:hypothetical protein
VFCLLAQEEMLYHKWNHKFSKLEAKFFNFSFAALARQSIEMVASWFVVANSTALAG